MYQAKTHGKDSFELFNVAMREQSQTRLTLENDLHYALERQEFELFYQPILSLASEQIIGFEALLRWHHPQCGLVSPTEFYPRCGRDRPDPTDWSLGALRSVPATG